VTLCTDHRVIDRPPAPRTQANSPPEEREVSVPCHRWGTTHAVPLLLITSGHRAGDGTWEPRPSRSRQAPSCKKGLSIASPFSHGAGGLPRKQSQHLAAHDAPPARIAVGELLNGKRPLGLALHTAVRRRGAELSAASYLTPGAFSFPIYSNFIPMRVNARSGWAAKRRHAAAMLE
jgi:hypothetical protein